MLVKKKNYYTSFNKKTIKVKTLNFILTQKKKKNFIKYLLN